VVALGTGFISTFVPATLQRGIPMETATWLTEPASRYTVVAVFLLATAAILAVDDMLPKPERAVPTTAGVALTPVGLIAVVALVAVLSLSWLTDFRWDNGRGQAALWEPLAAQMLTACQHSASGSIEAPAWTGQHFVIPCANLVR
jgi:hypothetical protein